jgi:hypothetical protein
MTSLCPAGRLVVPTLSGPLVVFCATTEAANINTIIKNLNVLIFARFFKLFMLINSKVQIDNRPR